MEEGVEEAGADTNAEVGAREACGRRSPTRGGRRRGRLGWLGLARLGAGPAQSAKKKFF